MLRTHTCGELRKGDSNKEVTLAGWVHAIRLHGNVTFIDLRDRYGITQCVLSEELKKDGSILKKEYVIQIKGQVYAKPEPNKKLTTGDVEVRVKSFEILNEAEPLPLDLEASNLTEETRLKWRFLDLRREKMQNNLITRFKVLSSVREFYKEHGFIEIETPILAKSTPEGARDYLVPSRVNPGNFYALPQSPQIFKQLCMVAGFDRYFQIVRCFRDEDLRGQRQPEFTQIDVEMSFVEQKDILHLHEILMKKLWKELFNVELKVPFERMTYSDAMESYGSDKPDRRFGLKLSSLNDLLRNTQCGIFKTAIDAGGSVYALNAKGAANLSRKDIDECTEVVKVYKAKGLAWLKMDKELDGPLAKFLSKEEKDALIKKLEVKKDDIVFFVADHKHYVCQTALGALRLHLGNKLNLIDKEKWDFFWVVDFPLVEYDEDEKRHIAVHHPFTSPKHDDIGLMDKHPLKVRAQAHDLVLNGVEIGGGSIRIHHRELQEKMFMLLGISKNEAEKKFCFLL
ncbi:aspartate--tRNA ligase, partial [Candidatus Woesearchaeota archaeon]|nr:aspartate--tRNA ligase [Candidatus Woesearchaeota archaeon]